MVDRIRTRKATYKVVSTALVVNEVGQRPTLRALLYRFRCPREAAGIAAVNSSSTTFVPRPEQIIRIQPRIDDRRKSSRDMSHSR